MKKIFLSLLLITIMIVTAACSSVPTKEKMIPVLEEKYNMEFTYLFKAKDGKEHFVCNDYPDFAFQVYEGYDYFLKEYYNYQFARAIDNALNKKSFTHVETYINPSELKNDYNFEELYKDTSYIYLTIVTTEPFTIDDAKQILNTFQWLKNHEVVNITAICDTYSTDNYDSLSVYKEYYEKNAVNYDNSPYNTFSGDVKYYKYSNETKEITVEEK